MGENENARSRTVWCGNLSEKTTEIILYELFLQAGPVEDVNIPKDKEGRRRNFAFVIFKHVESVPYAIELLNGINLFGRPLRLDGRDGSKLNDNPYRIAMNRHHRGLLLGNYKNNETGLTRIEDHSHQRITSAAVRIQQESQQQRQLRFDATNRQSWSQNGGPQLRVPAGLPFQMMSFMSGTTTALGYPHLNPHVLMMGNNAASGGVFPWQTVGQTLSNQLNQMPTAQEHWFNQINQRRF